MIGIILTTILLGYFINSCIADRKSATTCRI